MDAKSLFDAIWRDSLDGDAPLADNLRKIVALGGELGSARLREWASRELHGYAPDESVPDYRRPPAILMIDAIAGSGLWRGQQISPRALPAQAQEIMGDGVTLRQGVGGLEAMLATARRRGEPIKLTVDSAPEIARLMDIQHGEALQSTSALYWSLADSGLADVLDRIRTTLVELLSEMRAATPDHSAAPTSAIADQAVNVAVYGERARVTVRSAQVSGAGSATIEAGEGRGLWVKVVGAATIVAAVVAIAQWQGWVF